MSRPRAHRAATNPVLDALVGQVVPGGCDDCNAYQTFSRPKPHIYLLTVHHDPGCPWLAGVTR